MNVALVFQLISNRIIFFLIDRLVFELPEEMGLIAVAVRQTQGKGKFSSSTNESVLTV